MLLLVVFKGIVYGTIGVIAILSFHKLKQGGADESSLLAFLNQYTSGKILIWIILLGTQCYITWRITEAFNDPYGYGKDIKGMATRGRNCIEYNCRCLAYLFHDSDYAAYGYH